jgi:REP element-mobilizing transposase RayT
VGHLKKKNCHLYRINGIEDHIHIATHLHPIVNLSSLIKDIKLASSSFIQEQFLFRNFAGWQDGYAAFTYSFRDKDALIEYIKNQEEHHRKISSRDELIRLLDEHGVEFDEKYLL